jgi:hypothetical protein
MQGRLAESQKDNILRNEVSRRDFKEIAEIGFLMGMQYGFELALSFPPLQKK